MGYRKYLVIVLVFISLLLIGRLKKYLEKISENNQERMRMITKMKRIIVDTAMAPLNIVENVGIDFLTDALLA